MDVLYMAVLVLFCELFWLSVFSSCSPMTPAGEGTCVLFMFNCVLEDCWQAEVFNPLAQPTSSWCRPTSSWCQPWRCLYTLLVDDGPFRVDRCSGERFVVVLLSDPSLLCQCLKLGLFSLFLFICVVFLVLSGICPCFLLSFAHCSL